jgi:hypothetical protein
MPAIASIEDLRAAQEEGFSIYAMLYALPVLRSRTNCVGGCSMLYEDGVKSGGKMFASCGFRNAPQNN